MRIYIIHPEEKTLDYYEKIDAAEAKLLADEHHVVNPAPKDATFNNADLFRMYAPRLNTCDAVFAMNGWCKSDISNLEMANAMELKKIITFEQ